MDALKNLYCISACKTQHTSYTTVLLRMNSRGSKQVGDIKN